ncbi:type II toxin-antitoxin system RelE/ParE family toxin [Pararhizobium sp. A13]|uniref:type II toxin-antitoxin system RelE/ParE family toxin n=1 Tax=Pararhizobium sp. A13 TaxID=3133975 RepID=UPI00324FD393
MTNYTLTRRAEGDLLIVFLDGIEMFSLTQARRYKDELEHCFQLIASSPQMGRLAPAIGEGVQRHEHQSHIICTRKPNTPSQSSQSFLREVFAC